MRSNLFPELAEALITERRRRGLNQAELAARLGRAPPRISELERDLKTSRLGKDRLTLFAEICDALDLVPVLMRRDEAAKYVRSEEPPARAPSRAGPSVFDEVFVDLGEEAEAGSNG